LHPDYFTTRWTQSAGLPFENVQHHHAHAVACMVEHDLLDREVLGVIFDGTGFGADGTIWGGEILRATMTDFERVAALDTFALPGGEAAIRQPNRIALSLLVETFGYADVPRWLTGRLGLSQREIDSFVRMIAHNVNAPRTSSAGRLFDGVAALVLGIDTVSYEGEAALWLESIVDPAEESAYPMEAYTDALGLIRGDWRFLMRCLIEDLRADVSREVCAARFHNGLANWIAAVAARSALDDVVVGGGCFQNAVLTSRTRAALESLGKCVHVPSRIPANDGGLAVGQLAVALARTHRASQ
jgi:hydrogenase maturation protein HypF